MANNNEADHQEFAESNRAHRRDIKVVVVTNLLILLLLGVVYFLNQEYGFLDAVQSRF